MVSTSEEKGLEDLVSKFLKKNYPGERIVLNKNSSLGDKIDFLENEGYFVAPIFMSSNKTYSGTYEEGHKEIGGIITTRGNQQEQAKMLAKELNGESFVFNILYKNTKTSKEDLSCPLYPVISAEEVNEVIEQISLKESKELVKKDWQNLKSMSPECKKNCWADAIVQDARAFAFAPDDIRGNPWSIILAVKKTKKPSIILECAKSGDGLVKACRTLLSQKNISFSELPAEIQNERMFNKYNQSQEQNGKPWKPQDRRLQIKDKQIEFSK
jgi:hypothetical protein